jgi:YD repeat-containing protein
VIHDYSSQDPALGQDPGQPHRKLIVEWENDRVKSVSTSIPNGGGTIAGPRVDYAYTGTSKNLEFVRASDTSNNGGDTQQYEWKYGYDASNRIVWLRSPEHAAVTDGSRDYVNRYVSGKLVSQRDPEGNFTYIDYGFGSSQGLSAVTVTAGVPGPELVSGSNVDWNAVRLTALGDGVTRRTDYYNRRNRTDSTYQRVLVRYGQTVADDGSPTAHAVQADDLTAGSEVFRIDYDTVSPDNLDGSSGRLRRVSAKVKTDALDQASSYEALNDTDFDARGRVVGETTHVDATLANSRTVKVAYDPTDALLDRPISVTDATGIKTKLTYDANGDLTSSCTPLFSTPKEDLSCDSSNSVDQLTTVTYQPSPTVPSWWRPGMATKVTDPNGKHWLAEYNPQNGLPTTMTDPEGNVTRRTFDVAGRQTLVVPPKGSAGANDASNPLAWEFKTNLWGDVVEMKDPLDAVSTVTRDRGRRPTSTTGPGVQDGGGRTAQFDYDELGNPTRTEQANGVVLESAYWPGGALRSQTQDGATTTYHYPLCQTGGCRPVE